MSIEGLGFPQNNVLSHNLVAIRDFPLSASSLRRWRCQQITIVDVDKKGDTTRPDQIRSEGSDPTENRVVVPQHT